jgi:hypothetical protein
MAQKASHYWSPSRTYEFELKIGKVDLTSDLVSLSIITGIDLPYQTFILELYITPDNIILEQIYGQTPLKLTSKLFGTTPSVPSEQIEFELMYLASDMPVSTSIQSQSQAIHPDRKSVKITCVSRKAYTTMNTIVNYIYQGVTMSDVLSDLISKTGATPQVDTQGINSQKIDQILVPSSTLYKNLSYLNRTFGIYDGMAAFNCTYDNKVVVKNITNKIKSSETFVLYQLPLDSNNMDTINKCNDGIHYYTTTALHTVYNGNAAFAYMAPKMRHIVKPKDRLYHTIDIELETLCKKYGLISKGTKMFVDSQAIPVKTRVAIHKDHTGYETSETFINAKYSKRVSSLTEMDAHVEQSMKILSLMDVGETIKLDTKIDITRDFTGIYIIKASQLNFNKTKEWQSSCDLQLIRTNRTIT